MWLYETPCQKRPELFTPRRGGEEYGVYVMRADAARMTCENICDRADDCRDYTMRVAATGISAGSLYEEGEKKEWPTIKPFPSINPADYRNFVKKRQSHCCKECEEEYISQKNNPLCTNCRRKEFKFYTGEGEADGESHPSSIGYRPGIEAA